MASRAKVPFTRRRKGFSYYPDTESDDEDDDNQKFSCSVQDSERRKSDITDGEIQRLDRAKLFQHDDHDNDDVIDFLPRQKRDVYTDNAQGESIPRSFDSRDMGTYRKEMPPPKAGLAPENYQAKPRKDFVYEFGWFELLIGFGSIFVFIADFGTDINLVVQYFLKGQIMFGSVSLILTAGPSLVTCFLGLHWYILDYRREQADLHTASQNPKDVKKYKMMKKYNTSNCQWALRFILTILQFGPVIRVAEYMYYGYKSKKTADEKKEEKKHYHMKMLCEDVDACLLRLFESFLESAPQLTWQLYVWIILRDHNDVVQLYTRVFTLLSSWMALSVSLVSYHRALRYSREEKLIMRRRAIPFYFIWRTSEVGNRVLCICLFASSFHAIVFIPIGLHWCFISTWLMCQKTSFYGHRGFEIVFNIICGYVMIFCFLNLKEGHTRFRYLLYYLLFYIENISMLAVWFLYSSHVGEWFHVGGLVAVALLTGLHIFFQLAYYMFCHPNEKIELCLPCDKNLCYEFLCHDLNDKNTSLAKNPLDQEIVVRPPNTENGSGGDTASV